MIKKVALVIIILLTCGCSSKTYLKDDKNISINYPNTNISVLDEEISKYINKVYFKFKKNPKGVKLDISYSYKDVNEDVVNISLKVHTVADKSLYKIKTFTYDKKKEKFLSMEDIVRDIEAFDYDIKKKLIEKYSDTDIEYLNSISLDYFEFDDDILRVFLYGNVSNNKDIIHLDIPLNSLDLTFSIYDDTYFSIKKKDIDLDDKVVALTFDDGPSKYTGMVLDVLKKYKACATFFVVGEKALYNGEYLRRMLKEGSEIGNHSYDHKVLTNMSESEFKNEVNNTQEVIKNITGYTPTLFRPTYGGYTNRLKEYTELSFVLWDVDSRDWKVKSRDKIINNVIPYVKSGSIVLFHDNHEYALNSLDDIVFSLKKDGYKFVTVSELLEFKRLREEA